MPFREQTGTFSRRRLLQGLALPALGARAQKANSDVRVHSKPKPLAASAVMEDWTCFLGPTHNAKSGETKLLHQYGKDGPKLVWEMKKGTGYSSPAIAKDHLVFQHRQGSEEIVECLA